MTVRSVIIGLFVAVGLASFGYINDTWFFFSYIGGDLLPTHAFGLVVLGLLLANPLLGWLGRWKLRASEWTVILGMAFMGSVLAGSGWFWQYPHPLITPIREQIDSPGWQDKDLLQYAPRIMMVDARPTPDNKNPDEVNDYIQGLAKGKERGLVGFTRLPWHAWVPTLSFWFTLLGLCFVGGICAAVIVHRQWSKREQLAYPIVTFTNELMAGEGPALGQDRPVSIFRRRPFWIGFALAFGVLLINGYQRWNTGFITVPVGVNCSSLQELGFFKALRKVPDTGNFLNIKFYFAAVGLAYFLTSEASFSIGISGWLYVLVMAPLVARGLKLDRGLLTGGVPTYMYFGAYAGMALMTLYLGRRFYWAVLKRACFLPGGRAEVLSREANALRILLLVSAAIVALLWAVGLPVVLGVAFVVLTGMLFLIIARINVATGLFMIQPFWQPVTVMVGLLGAYAMGPHAIAILALLATAVTIDTRIAALPLVSNALKLGDDQRVRPGRLAGAMSVAVVAALVVATIFTVWLIYSYGAKGVDSEGTKWAITVAKMPMELDDEKVNDLESNYQLAEAREGMKLARIRPDDHFVPAALVGMGLVLACSYLRLRFPRWPLHPVMFVVWGTTWTVAYAPSFLLAWLAKGLIMKYGGQRMYVKARGFFIGLVAGELAVALLWAGVGVIYYMQTGKVGEHFLTRD